MTRTALMLIDMQNSFLHPDGENFYPTAPEVVAPAKRLLAAARDAGVLVVHVAERHREGFTDYEQIRLPVHCLKGGFNSEFHEGFGPGNHAGEITIEKRRYSAFFATDLGLFLREQGVTRVVICGVKTNVCVRATTQDAFANGLEVVIAREATNSNRPNLAEASLEDIDRYFGKVLPVDDCVALLA
ncbi:cysteine hydrolase family protein [Pseudorhodobacter sp.]|uniref:cysteine hydrolase family protein n=1 Tax=Pseudorhodobacter sp. TaxID=1934400 RepID=UPI002647E738|nr:isochorismatase family cysteine hydrolase [Pseudorhodobacter sp.]MDN5789010.1 cysteine hydrolase [Pseudorhodobacter sp.]